MNHGVLSYETSAQPTARQKRLFEQSDNAILFAFERRAAPWRFVSLDERKVESFCSHWHNLIVLTANERVAIQSWI